MLCAGWRRDRQNNTSATVLAFQHEKVEWLEPVNAALQNFDIAMYFVFVASANFSYHHIS